MSVLFENRQQVRFWKAALLLLALTLFATELFQRPGFWGGYVRDIVGPPVFYVFLRGLHRPMGPRDAGCFFSASRTALMLFGACLVIEGIQYFELYSGYFDPYDLVAYGAGILACYTLDRVFTENRRRANPRTV
jgi:hypothetical protein